MALLAKKPAAQDDLQPGGSERFRQLRRLLRSYANVAALVLVLLALALVVLGPAVAPHPIDKINATAILKAPSAQFLMGTDHLGRDVFSRLVVGARVSVLVGLLATAVSGVIGVVLGVVAGYSGKWADEIIMRVMDLVLAFPSIILAMALVALIGPGYLNLIIAVAVVRVPQFARVARSSVLSLREQEFVLAATAVGAAPLRTLFRHILPNAMAPLVIMASLSIATAINAEASLSFLGLGVKPPMSSWGTMLAEGRNYLRDAPWLATMPGLAISLTTLAFNLLGDGLRDVFDPRMKEG